MMKPIPYSRSRSVCSSVCACRKASDAHGPCLGLRLEDSRLCYQRHQNCLLLRVRSATLGRHVKRGRAIAKSAKTLILAEILGTKSDSLRVAPSGCSHGECALDLSEGMGESLLHTRDLMVRRGGITLIRSSVFPCSIVGRRTHHYFKSLAFTKPSHCTVHSSGTTGRESYHRNANPADGLA